MSNNRDLLLELIKTNFKLRYNNSFLGFIWVLIKPFAIFTILYLVWSAFRGQNIENYQVKLLLGIIIYTFVNEGVIFGMNGLLDKAHIILKVNFPREVAVLSSVAMALVNLIINLVIFGVFSLFNPVDLSLTGVIWFFITILITALLVYGIDLFLSIFLIKLRDLEHISELFFQLMFWATPIFYELSMLDGNPTVQTLISYNPLGWIIQICREALINGRIAVISLGGMEVSSVWILLILLLLSLLLIVTGKIYFKNEVKKVAEYF